MNSVANRMEKFGVKESVSTNNIKGGDFENVESGGGDPSVEFTTIIEAGHDTLMKALRSRYRNIQSVSIMWSRGDIKSALDKVVDINDNSVIADILREINSHPYAQFFVFI